jgi:pimeloyl-ACP methyl ester carboxylesterase
MAHQITQCTVAGSGPPLVLVHGVASSAAVWARNLGPLAEHHRVYQLDLFAAPSRAFALDASADALGEWVANLPDGPAVLVGHSMGGYLAARVAATHPRAVSRLVLVDAAAVPSRLSLAARALRVVRAGRRDDAATRALVAAGMRQSGRLRCWRAALQTLRSDLGPELGRIRVPTLVVWGADDAVVPIDVGERLAASIPQARLAVLDGAGHMPMWEEASAFNALLGAWLNGDVLGASPEVALRAGSDAPRLEWMEA